MAEFDPRRHRGSTRVTAGRPPDGTLPVPVCPMRATHPRWRTTTRSRGSSRFPMSKQDQRLTVLCSAPHPLALELPWLVRPVRGSARQVHSWHGHISEHAELLSSARARSRRRADVRLRAGASQG